MVSVWPQWWRAVGGPRDKIWDLVAFVWPNVVGPAVFKTHLCYWSYNATNTTLDIKWDYKCHIIKQWKRSRTYIISCTKLIVQTHIITATVVKYMAINLPKCHDFSWTWKRKIDLNLKLTQPQPNPTPTPLNADSECNLSRQLNVLISFWCNNCLGIYCMITELDFVVLCWQQAWKNTIPRQKDCEKE